MRQNAFAAGAPLGELTVLSTSPIREGSAEGQWKGLRMERERKRKERKGWKGRRWNLVVFLTLCFYSFYHFYC